MEFLVTCTVRLQHIFSPWLGYHVDKLTLISQLEQEDKVMTEGRGILPGICSGEHQVDMTLWGIAVASELGHGSITLRNLRELCKMSFFLMELAKNICISIFSLLTCCSASYTLLWTWAFISPCFCFVLLQSLTFCPISFYFISLIIPSFINFWQILILLESFF